MQDAAKTQINVVYDMAAATKKRGFVLDIRCPSCGATWQVTDGVDPFKIMESHDASICSYKQVMDNRFKTKRVAS